VGKTDRTNWLGGWFLAVVVTLALAGLLSAMHGIALKYPDGWGPRESEPDPPTWARIGAWTVFGLVLLSFPFPWLFDWFNELVRGRNACSHAWANVESLLKRRYDLIPNLVEVVRGYAQHERGALEAVTNARSQALAIRSSDVNARAQAESKLTNVVHRLVIATEAYPNLKADHHFQRLMGELIGTENALAAARGTYNEAVAAYENVRQSIPTNLVAKLLRFQPRAYFSIPSFEAVNPQVRFAD
jgi:LemA protein